MYVNVENVNFAYDKKPILHDINFGMNKGEITGLIGPNGAGKSTMLKLMIKKMKPDNGKIIIGDNDIFSIKRENNPVTFIPDIAFHCFVIEKRKSLCHSLGRPSRSDFVQFQFV